MDQGSNRKHSAVHNFAPTVTKFCVMWEGQALPHDTKFCNCRCEIVGRGVIFIWSLIPGSSWSGLIKAEPGRHLDIKTVFPGMGIFIIKIRQLWDHLILIMPIPTLVRWYLYNDMAPGVAKSQGISSHCTDLILLEYSSLSTRRRKAAWIVNFIQGHDDCAQVKIPRPKKILL